MNLSQQAIEAIEKGASAETLAKLKGELSARRGEISQRLETIGEQHAGFPGAERRAAIASGDYEALEKLDNEVRRLQSELQAIQHCEQRLHTALVAQKAREAVDGMPAQFKALDGLLDAEREALAALRTAQANTDKRLSEMRAGRQAVNMARNTGAANLTAPAGQPETLSTLLELRGIAYDDLHGYGRDAHKVERMADDLGLTISREAQTMPNAAGWL